MSQALVKALNKKTYFLFARDQLEDTVLHAIARSTRKDKLELLMALMIYSDFGCDYIGFPEDDNSGYLELIDYPAANGNTALHITVQVMVQLYIIYIIMYNIVMHN